MDYGKEKCSSPRPNLPEDALVGGNENADFSQGSDQDPLIRDQVKVYRMRWVNLGLFSLVTLSNAVIWISLSAITDIVERYYNIRALLVDWLSLTFLIVPSFTAVPGTFVLSRLGLKLSIALPACFHAIGTAVRIGGMKRENFTFVAVGQSIAAFGTIFILATPPQLASVWFSDNERTTATTIGVQTNVLGIAIGFLLSTMLVPDTDNVDLIGIGMRNLFLTHGVFCFVLFLLVLGLVRDAPATAPSLSQAAKEQKVVARAPPPFFQSILSLMKGRDYNLVTLAYSINFGVVFSLPTLLNQMMKVKNNNQEHHISESSVGWVGFVGPLGGIAGSLLASLLLDRFKKYKLMTCLCLLLSSISILVYSQILLQTENVYLIAVIFTTLCFFSFPYLGYGLDHIAEISYPVSEGAASASPMILGNLSGFLQIYIFQIIIDNGYLNAVLYVYIGLQIVALVLSLLAKTEMKRYDFENTVS